MVRTEVAVLVAGVLAGALVGCNAILGLGTPTVEEPDGSLPDGATDSSSGDATPSEGGGPGDAMGSDSGDGGDSGDATHPDGGPDTGMVTDSGGGGDGADSSRSDSEAGPVDSGGDTGQGDTGQGDTGGGDTGQRDSGAATWTPLALGSAGDAISGIWFSSLDAGVVTVQGTSGGVAGQVFGMSGPLDESKELFSGNGVDAGGISMTLTFQGLVASSYGLVAVANAAVLVGSIDNGASFNSTTTGITGTTAPLAWLALDTMGRWTAVESSIGGPAFYQTLTGSPGLPATWLAPTYPFNGLVSANPNPAYWQSGDGQTIVVSSMSGTSVSVSTTAGASFSDTPIQGAPGDGAYPTVIAFSQNGQFGLAASALESGTPYAASSSDGGNSWKAGTLPANVAATAPEFGNGFISPDGSHVWIIGFNGNTNDAVLYLSTDSGATYTDISAKVNLYDQQQGEWIIPGGIGGGCGFALDNENIWLGSANGNLWYSPTGGQ